MMLEQNAWVMIGGFDKGASEEEIAEVFNAADGQDFYVTVGGKRYTATVSLDESVPVEVD